MEIWHNPRCSKSRQTLALLESAGVTPTVRRYLEDPPPVEQIGAVLIALGVEPWDLVRMGEDEAKTLGLKDWPRDRDRWIAAMAANPRLIQRPVVIADDGRVVIGRPPENVQGLL
jgi:arsenate reductase